MTALVYPVRERSDTYGLRMSLRSAERNLQADITQLVIVGGKPDWLKDAIHIPGNLHPQARRNVFSNILLATQSPLVEEDIIFMNDDFFILKPYTPRVAIRSPLKKHMKKGRRSDWKTSLETTYAWLVAQGYEDPWSYELHIPLPAPKYQMRQALEIVEEVEPTNPPQWRTIWGNLFSVPAKIEPDVKITARSSSRWAEMEVASCTPVSIGSILEYMQEEFREPSRWESSW